MLEFPVNSDDQQTAINKLTVTVSGLADDAVAIRLNAKQLETARTSNIRVPLDAITVRAIRDAASLCKAGGHKLHLVVEMKLNAGKLAFGAPAFRKRAGHVRRLLGRGTAQTPRHTAESLAKLAMQQPPEAFLQGLVENRPPARVVDAALRLLVKEKCYFRLIDLESALSLGQFEARLNQDVLFHLLWNIARALVAGDIGALGSEYYARAARLPSFVDISAGRSVDFHCGWALALVRAGRPGDAIALLRGALSKHPNSPRLVAELALILLHSDPLEARVVLSAVPDVGVVHTPNLAMKLLNARTRTLIKTGALEDALKLILETDSVAALHHAQRMELVNAYLASRNEQQWREALMSWFPEPVSATIDLRLEKRPNVLDRLTSRPLPQGKRPDDAALVVVIMTVFNAADTLEYSVRSVLAQTHRNLRLVIVEDCSTDRSLAVARQLATTDNRIMLLVNRENSGTYVSKNRAMQVVAGDYYTFHDSDDWMHPERVERHCAAMRAKPAAVASYSKWIRLDADGFVAVGSAENPASSFFSRSLIDTVGYFDSVRAAADTEFRWRHDRRFGMAATTVLDEVLTIGLSRPGSLTTGGAAAKDAFGYSATPYPISAGMDTVAATGGARGEAQSAFPFG